MRRLVPYDYRLHTCQLDDDEAQTYRNLTLQIAKYAAQGSGSDADDSFATSSSSGLGF